MKKDKRCVPLTWSERNYIWHALHTKKHDIIDSGTKKVYKSYVADLSKLLKKFKD